MKDVALRAGVSHQTVSRAINHHPNVSAATRERVEAAIKELGYLRNIGDRFRLVASEIDVVDPDQPMPKLPVARAVWLSRPDLYAAAERWITAGAPHHSVLSTQLTGDILEDFAEIVQTELAITDPHTTKRDFIDRLRWNAAYYRLQGGI